MKTKMQFRHKADVVTAGGEKVGDISRVVLNPETRVITHIVVRMGTLLDVHEKVVPVEDIDSTTEEQIVLRRDAEDPESFLPLEEKHYVSPEEQRPPSAPVTARPSLAYGTPMVGALSDPAAPGEGSVTHVDLNIPEGSVAMKEGARVITADDDHVGSVERVLATAGPKPQATDLVISMGKLAKEKKLIPITWVTLLGEEDVHLSVKHDAVEKLPEASIAH
jgi:uncharacterized protein YrrD